MPTVRYMACGASGPHACHDPAHTSLLSIDCLLMQGMSVKYNSALDCVRKIVREEGGILALYKGAGAGILRTVSGHAEPHDESSCTWGAWC
jgi:hypothetical protein